MAHAHYMANQFNKSGIPSLALTGLSAQEERNTAKHKLVSGEIRFIFVVDIYNEGVDIPEVNTVLFLRPTESLTIFLQQLGRGLRLSEGKECLTVLDFIGQAHKKYNFEDKFAALLGNSRKSVQSEIRTGFSAAPKGCYIQLERVAQQYVLDNIRSSFGQKSGLVGRLATFVEDSGKELSLSNFLNHYHLDPRAVFSRGSFSRLCVAAGVQEDFSEPLEDDVTRALLRICDIDSRRLIGFVLDNIDKFEDIDLEELSEVQAIMLRMFCITLWPDLANNLHPQAIKDKLSALANCPVMLNELKMLLSYNHQLIDFVDEPVPLGFPFPLDLHCNYTRDQIFVGLRFDNPRAVREGVKWLPEANCDVFTVTLNKSAKDYSPTTMYQDYSINEHLFHWQSQSTTTPESPTGQRYQTHGHSANRMLLFVREFKQGPYRNTAPYTFLGLADYVSHEGSRPMSITYRLHRPIPAKYLKKTNKLLVG